MDNNPDQVTSWLNFAQSPREQGGLGLAPHQAAGLVGNLVNESGPALNPWGPTGDNGTAMGTAQWRGDRLDALKQAFPDSYQTPQAQQTFMRQEFDGPENKAYQALLASKSPEDAAGAVNHLYERSADNSGNREKAARQLMTQFGSGAPGALTSAFAKPDDDDEDAPALSANATLGPGALSSRPLPQVPPQSQAQHLFTSDGATNPLNTIGQGLTGMGAAIAGISSPGQAMALTNQLAQMKKDTESKYKIAIGKNGQIIRYDQDGNVDAIGGNPTDPNASQSPQMIPTWGNVSALGNDPTASSKEQQEAFLSSMQGGQGEMVRAILENRLPITANAFTRKDSPYPAAFAAAAKIDPTIDPTVYMARQAGQRDWATKGAESARALNQTISHQSNVLLDAMNGLDNVQSPLANDVKNWWSEKVQGKGAVPGFRTTAHAVVDELGKVFKQNNLSDTEIRKWEENLPTNMSPEQQRTQVGVMRKLMGGAMDALENKRSQAIGAWAAAKQRPLLSDEGTAGLQKLEAFANSGPPTAAKPNATLPSGVKSIQIVQ